MKIVVGLGNPGNQYKDTRHNIGFLVVDELARRWNAAPWKRRYEAEVSEHRAIGPVLLVKPQTFMNLSGVSVREAAKFYKTPVTDIIVVHDDLDLPSGRLRIRERGGSGGHRGIESILAQVRRTPPPGRLAPPPSNGRFYARDAAASSACHADYRACCSGRRALHCTSPRQ